MTAANSEHHFDGVEVEAVEVNFVSFTVIGKETVSFNQHDSNII